MANLEMAAICKWVVLSGGRYQFTSWIVSSSEPTTSIRIDWIAELLFIYSGIVSGFIFFVLFLFLFSFILIWNVFGALAAGQSATAEDEWLNRWDLIQIDRAFDFNLNSIAMASDCGPLFRDHQ